MKHSTQVIHGVANAIALAEKLEAETGTGYEVVNFRMLLEGHRLYQDMGEEEVSNYLIHLAVHRKVTSATQNLALCSIVFI